MEIPCAVPPDVAEEIEQIARTTDRSRSQIARKMVWRGLAAYRRDGNLDEPAEVMAGSEVAIVAPAPINSHPRRQKAKAAISSQPKGGKK